MSVKETTVRGTLSPDGILVLDEKPQVPPGRVQVMLRPLADSSPPRDHWWDYLQQARADLERSGRHFRTKEEIDAEIDDLRSGDERIEEAIRLAEEAARQERAQK